jgi:uncharacterized protein (TIGR02284 family)
LHNGALTMENRTTAPLQELRGSGHMLAPGVTDISGWAVADLSGNVIGEVADLLFDAAAGQVRYLVVTLSPFGKKVIVPIGLAERHPDQASVILPELMHDQLAQLPEYDNTGTLDADKELAVRHALEGHSTAPYEHPQFYIHQHFNEDRLYQTDLSEETAEAAEARAERASRIVARLEQPLHNPSIDYPQPIKMSENMVEVLNDLIQINNDRIEGFEKAAENLEEPDSGLSAVFNKLADESRANAVELTHIVREDGYEAVEGSSTSGALHRAWLDIKSAFTGGDLEAVLNECETGEDAIKAAYRSALNDENVLSPELVATLQRQQIGITEGHDLIKSLRDQVRTDNNDDTEDATVYQENESIADEPSYEGAAGEYGSQPASLAEPESSDQPEEVTTGNSKLMEFFINQLKDLLWAEQELVETLPELAEAATSQELKSAFMNHHTETIVHARRLHQIFEILGLEPETKMCEAMAGIVDEGEEIISATEQGTAQRDVGLIFAGQKAEHYEIASYGGMIALAKTLGYYEIAELFVLTLDEEKTADAKLTEIAENQANYDASLEAEDN